jgi:hypothetical protein
VPETVSSAISFSTRLRISSRIARTPSIDSLAGSGISQSS